MIEKKEALLGKTLKVSGLLFLLTPFFFLIHIPAGVAVVAGVLLSSIFIASSALTLDMFGNSENSVFIKAFFISTALRFALILILFGILLEVVKINEIFFTVSFIISYLCLSVTEMIFINKILQKSGK